MAVRRYDGSGEGGATANGGSHNGSAGLPAQGNCSTPQAVFNTFNLVVGLGFLSLPFCLRQSGWFFAGISFLLIHQLFLHTAHLAVRSLTYNPAHYTPTSFADLGAMAWGSAGRTVAALLVTLELWGADCAILMVASLNLHILVEPLGVSLLQCKLALGVAMWATTFADLRRISFGSLVGMAASATLVGVIVVCGLVRTESPGSVWQPMETHWEFMGWRSVLIWGVFASCLSGHAVHPNIYFAMKDREQFPRVLNVAFGLIAALYVTMCAFGYLEFGDTLSDVITNNLAALPSPPIILTLNKIVIVLMIAIPLTKFALLADAVALPIETAISQHILRRHLERRLSSASRADRRASRADLEHAALDASASSASSAESASNDSVLDEDSPLLAPLMPPPAHPPHTHPSRLQADLPRPALLSLVRPATRTLLSLSCLACALALPGLTAVLALMGSALSVGLSVVLPAAVFLKLFRYGGPVEGGLGLGEGVDGLPVGPVAGKPSRADVVGAWACVVGGLVVGTVGTVGTVWNVVGR